MTDIEFFGKSKEAWLRTLLKLPNGIPSHDTFGRLFLLLDPVAFQHCFINWVRDVHETIQGVVAIDGKNARRSQDTSKGKKAIHLVSAWATENGVALGHVKNRRQAQRNHRYPRATQASPTRNSLAVWRN